jgi:hypothetical protein
MKNPERSNMVGKEEFEPNSDINRLQKGEGKFDPLICKGCF